MKAFRVLAVLSASTALAFGTAPAFAEVLGDDAVDASGELPLDENGGTVVYEDAGSGEVVGDPGVEDGSIGEVGDPVEGIDVKDGDPMPYERELDGADMPEMFYTTGGPAVEDFASSAADDAAEAAADNAADKALERAEASAGSRIAATAE